MFESKRKPAHKTILWMTATVAVMLALSLSAAADPGRVKKRDSAIGFTNDLDDALEQAKATGTPVYLSFGAVWCPVCRRMKEATLLEPPMQALADDFIWWFYRGLSRPLQPRSSRARRVSPQPDQHLYRPPERQPADCPFG
jgi:thiol-disulfide isomerase/thioredoxin